MNKIEIKDADFKVSISTVDALEWPLLCPLFERVLLATGAMPPGAKLMLHLPTPQQETK